MRTTRVVAIHPASARSAVKLSKKKPAENHKIRETNTESEGEHGGRYVTRSGRTGRWTAVLPGAEPIDSYGCGDSFAAGLTYGLSAGLELATKLNGQPLSSALLHHADLKPGGELAFVMGSKPSTWGRVGD